MEPTLTTNLLTAKNTSDISMLAGPSGSSSLLPEGDFSSNLEVAWQAMLAKDGKLQPLQLAALQGLDSEQLLDLSKQLGITLPEQLIPDSIEAGQKLTAALSQLLNKDLNTEQDTISANPVASALLNIPLLADTKTDEFTGSDLLDTESFDGTALKKEIINNASTTKDVIHHVQNKKDSELSQVLNSFDKDLASQLNHLAKSNIGLHNNIDASSAKQVFNISKLTDQYSAVDRPVNAVNTVAHHAVQTNYNQDQSGAMLRRVDVPVYQAEWGQAVGDRLLTMVNDKVQTAHIHLNPPELGPIEVRVNVNNDKASVHFVSNHTAVRDAIEDAFPKLKEMFMQNGLSLMDANVSQHPSHQRQQYSGEQNQFLPFTEDTLSDSLGTADSITQARVIDIGLVDHYV